MSTSAESSCPDCSAAVGHPHHKDCDVTRCLRTGLGRFGCEGGHDCGSDVWTGEWPGTQECIEYGFVLTYPDLNRLHAEASWDPDRGRWVKSDAD